LDSSDVIIKSFITIAINLILYYSLINKMEKYSLNIFFPLTLGLIFAFIESLMGDYDYYSEWECTMNFHTNSIFVNIVIIFLMYFPISCAIFLSLISLIKYYFTSNNDNDHLDDLLRLSKNENKDEIDISCVRLNRISQSSKSNKHNTKPHFKSESSCNLSSLNTQNLITFDYIENYQHFKLFIVFLIVYNICYSIPYITSLVYLMENKLLRTKYLTYLRMCYGFLNFIIFICCKNIFKQWSVWWNKKKEINDIIREF